MSSAVRPRSRSTPEYEADQDSSVRTITLGVPVLPELKVAHAMPGIGSAPSTVRRRPSQ